MNWPETNCYVVGSLRPGWISIHVAYNHGHNNGGGFVEFRTEEIPKELRLPNTLLWIKFNGGACSGNILSIKAMSKEDALRYRPTIWKSDI